MPLEARALAGRAELEAFARRSVERLEVLDSRIDRAYAIAERLEAEREELLLRLDEAEAMVEAQDDDEGFRDDEDGTGDAPPWVEDQRLECPAFASGAGEDGRLDLLV